MIEIDNTGSVLQKDRRGTSYADYWPIARREAKKELEELSAKEKNISRTLPNWEKLFAVVAAVVCLSVWLIQGLFAPFDNTLYTALFLSLVAILGVFALTGPSEAVVRRRQQLEDDIAMAEWRLKLAITIDSSAPRAMNVLLKEAKSWEQFRDDDERNTANDSVIIADYLREHFVYVADVRYHKFKTDDIVTARYVGAGVDSVVDKFIRDSHE